MLMPPEPSMSNRLKISSICSLEILNPVLLIACVNWSKFKIICPLWSILRKTRPSPRNPENPLDKHNWRNSSMGSSMLPESNQRWLLWIISVSLWEMWPGWAIFCREVDSLKNRSCKNVSIAIHATTSECLLNSLIDFFLDKRGQVKKFSQVTILTNWVKSRNAKGAKEVYRVLIAWHVIRPWMF